jgi:hypothetical protein
MAVSRSYSVVVIVAGVFVVAVATDSASMGSTTVCILSPFSHVCDDKDLLLPGGVLSDIVVVNRCALVAAMVFLLWLG